MSKHRAHLEAVIASARLRDRLQDSGYARVAIGDFGREDEVINLNLRVAALRLSLAVETVSGDKPRPVGDKALNRAYETWTRWA